MSRFNKGDVEKKAESSGWQVHGGKSVHVSVPKDQWTATLQESHRKAGVYSAGAKPSGGASSDKNLQ